MSRYTVRDLVERYGTTLQFEIIVGGGALDREILMPEAQRTGLSLAGYLTDHCKERLLIFTPAEVTYLADLDDELCKERIRGVCFEKTPVIVFSQDQMPCARTIAVCTELKMPLIRSSMETNDLLGGLYSGLCSDFAPTTSRHGTLVEVFGVGVLIEGESGVGKSEAGLGLLERGHRLISDDVVQISKEDDFLRGTGVALTRHQMEIRGIGIIDVAQLYGAVCVRECIRIDLVACLKEWNEDHFHDRVGLDEATCSILDVAVPYHVVPVKPGRDVVLLLETLALRHRLKGMGRCPARAFSARLTEAIAERSYA